MAKHIIFNPTTGEKKEIIIEDEKIEEVVIEPTLEERLQAIEDALLIMLDMEV